MRMRDEMQEIYTHRKKKWVVCPRPEERDVRAVSERLGCSTAFAALLCARGLSDPNAAYAFTHLTEEQLYDPFLMRDMREAVVRIMDAVKAGEQITIYGDYDVDGVTAVSTLYLYLHSHGAKVDYFIPNRLEDGYGVTVKATEALISSGTQLFITVDTGITAADEVEYAKSRGVDFVITDHHECRSDLPDAVAVINPHRPDDDYPFKDLAGVGVVFKLICALESTMTGEEMLPCVMRMTREYGDLFAVGTIADVMPIKGENRLLVKQGLRLIEHTERVGLTALMTAAANSKTGGAAKYKKQKINTSYIGYTIAPRINAAGRIRSATVAADLFLTDDPVEAASLAEELCEANKERQSEENRITGEAFAKLEEQGGVSSDRPVIVLWDDHWHHGVIGIVSSRLTERYHLPSILISFEGCEGGPTADDVGKGSGRSIPGMSLMDALVNCSDLLVKYGGHELAAGLSVTRGNLEAFRQRINAYARTHLSAEACIPTLSADLELPASELNMEFAESLAQLEPFGPGNLAPVFVTRGMHLYEVTPVSGGKHLRFSLGDGEHTAVQAMYFSHSSTEFDMYVGDTVDVMYTLDINVWNGRKSVQMIVKDIVLSASELDSEECERERFSRIWNGEPFHDASVVPTREDFAAVYVLVRKLVRSGNESVSHRFLLAQLTEQHIGYVKLKFIIRILQEMNLLGIEEPEEEFYRFHLNFSQNKTDLEKSNLLRRLRAQQKQG